MSGLSLVLAFAADLVLSNGKVWTGAGADAQAVAISHGRIIAIGSNTEIRAWKAARVIDLHGRRVVPGFRDSHVHFLDSGLGLSRVALKDAPDEAEFGRRLREFDHKLPPGRWMLGGDWDHDRAFGGKLPSAELIDKYVRDRPVFLNRYDGHMGVANSKAMALAKADKSTHGIFRDNAMAQIYKAIPDPSDVEIAEGVAAALAEAAKNGVTAVEDMDGSSPETRKKLFAHYRELARTGKLTCRIGLYWPLALWKEIAGLGGLGDEWVRIGGVKGFVDGSIGSSTAKMFEPYLNEPGSTGLWVTPPDSLRTWIRAADAAGIPIAVHAIGDKANATLLDIYADLPNVREKRLRVEHAQHLRAEDIARFAKLGVIASEQPYHAIDDGRWVEGRIGKARCATSYAWKSLLDAGAHVAFGSDWAVAPLSALLGIDAAVNRRTLDGKNPGGWFPEQRVTVQQALVGYTREAAFAAHREGDEGTLEPGKLADLVVLSRDILAPAERDHIAETQVVMTIVGGKVVYSSSP
jgi:predicted amidohydrolase YtcJ